MDASFNLSIFAKSALRVKCESLSTLDALTILVKSETAVRGSKLRSIHAKAVNELIVYLNKVLLYSHYAQVKVDV